MFLVLVFYKSPQNNKPKPRQKTSTLKIDKGETYLCLFLDGENGVYPGAADYSNQDSSKP